MTTKQRRERLEAHVASVEQGKIYVTAAHNHLASIWRAPGAPNRLDLEVSAQGPVHDAVDRLQARRSDG